MYSNYFGFKERPFKLLPDPTYLFLSKSHEEALAHLKYALGHGDGFVEITGEVGTGKTTLCRVFLDRLQDDTEAAYIFNPRLDEVQLLKTINDELGIASSANNTKDLIDDLNVFLIQMKASDKNVILIIDEAQNLSVDVLEQLRLLSNLETTQSKLLQIILVGQPELGDMLDSHELRQLGQRITLSCYLAPLTFKETSAYIEHRLQIALTKPGKLFSKNALKDIYRYAGGIPRLINIICDRSLLIAYSRNRKKVSGNIVRMAIRELSSRGDRRKRFPLKNRTTALLIIAVVAVLCVLLLPGMVQHKTELVPSAKLPDPASGIKDTPAVVYYPAVPEKVETTFAEPVRPEAVKTVALGAFLEQANPVATRYNAMKELLSLWKVENHIQPYLESLQDDNTFFNLVTRQNGLEIQMVDGNPDLILKLNLPAIFKFESTVLKTPLYLTLEKIHENQAFFRVQGLETSVTVPYNVLVAQFKGTAFIVWKNYMGFEGVLPLSSPKGSVIMLKMMLRDIGYEEVALTPEFDTLTQVIIKDLQFKHGIDADGFVGPLTKIVLYNEKEDFSAPRLVTPERLLNDIP
ncbi:MAG: AAA family ATPase [Desulfobacterales bacterium]|nr:AAA family ATPase [Desulfobacterales bacterium]MDX2510712.1 AAA family ATPase [Desulfobacterales bacterium]